MDLSIIVPAYNAKELAHHSARLLQGYFEDLGIAFEIILVDDGSISHQRPEEKLLPTRARLLQLQRNRGKGFAVRAGISATTGRCRVFTDVDLPYGLRPLETCYRAITENGMDFVHGDRSLPASSIVANPSWRRRVSSGVFRFAVSSIVGLQPTDTQCGLKAFSGDVADALVKLLRTDRFAFDVEIFRFARDNGFKVQAIPVQLVNEDVSTVRLLRDAVTMIRDLVAIRWRAQRGTYRRASLLTARDAPGTKSTSATFVE